MLISEKYNFIFIHIQKTGGTSLMEVLAENVSNLKPLCFKHDGAIEGIKEIGKKEWDKYTKFAVARNPWSRLVSWYSMIKNTPEKITKLRSYVHDNSTNFEEFILNCTDSIEDSDGIQSFTKNQIEYLIDDSKEIVVDYIGRFEKLDDFHKLFFEKTGLDIKIKIPHINHNSIHKHYTQYYTNNTKKIIEDRYKKDIQYFGYNFEEISMFKKFIDNIHTKRLIKRDINKSINYMSALKQGKFK